MKSTTPWIYITKRHYACEAARDASDQGIASEILQWDTICCIF